MALSPNSRHRSRLIREMSRDLNKTEHSCASSTGSQHGTVGDSTVSDFDPENEAIMSTRQFDTNVSQKLPELRDTAKKYGRWTGGRQQDFAINTSAIGRAFPDFSQGGSSDDSMSLEVGRGANSRQQTPSRTPRPDYSDNIDSPIVRVGDFQILSTPPIKHQTKATKQPDPLRNSLRKEALGKRTASHKENIPPTQASVPDRMTGYISGASRSNSGDHRRTLAELHAQVADDTDGSFMNDERPPTVSFTAKNSRFSGGQHRNSPLSAMHKFQKQQVNNSLADALSGRRNASATPQKGQTNGNSKSNTPNPTNQSFLLPNMPDISELLSGTFRDGTPVFTSSGKVQSRFSGSARTPSKASHNQLDSIPVPEDEKAIFLSLQLLQDKVASLEMEKADAQRVAEELQRDNYQLQAEKKQLEKHRRSDSGLGMADSGSDLELSSDNKKLIDEKTKLEAQLKSVQSRLEANDRKVANQDLRLKTVSAERDQAVKQLAQAFGISEELKSQNDALREENDALKAQLAQFMSESRENALRWQQKENALRKKVQRGQDAVREMREITREIQETRTVELVSRSKSSSKGRKDANEVESRQRRRSRSRSQSRHLLRTEMVTVDNAPRDEFDLGFIPAADDSLETSIDETTKTIHKDLNVNVNDMDESVDGSNFSSILGHGEMEKLRQILAEEKTKLRERQAAANEVEQHQDTARSTQSVQSTQEKGHSLRRKSSAKGLTGILKNRSTPVLNDDTGRLSIKSGANITTHSITSQQRRYSVTSTGKIHRITAEDVTSAFILPDITIHGLSDDADHPVLSAGARRVLDKLVHHNGQNCTVCSRVASFQTVSNNSSKPETKQTVRIEKPVPVSDRMPVAEPYEEEPTIRPSVAPGLALATVLKGLQDEVAHQKMDLARCQTLYNKHDPSLSLRKRKALGVKIDVLMKSIDVKSDQIYALYDVLEGQKQSGQEMTDEDVEITLQSIGVNMDDSKTDKPDMADNKDDDDSDDDSELDLPWEGIEDTTGSLSVKKGRRQSWHA